MKRIFFFLLTAVIFICITVMSCNKAEIDQDITSAQDNTIAENGYGKTMTNISSIGINEEGIKKNGAGFFTINSDFTCAAITFEGDTSLFPQQPVTVVIDYGTGCTDQDGRVRSGIVKATFDDVWKNVGATITVSFNNYAEDGTTYEGTMTIVHKSAQTYTTSVNNGKVKGSGWTVEYDGDKTIIQVQGFNTDTITDDDVYEITGSSTGVNRKGGKYTTNITKKIVMDNSCKWPTSGTVELTPDGFATRTIDFGDGTCDSKASVIINGNEFTFTMN